MNMTEILKEAGAHKRRKRIGRGRGSGWGKTSGRGHNGAGQRAGSGGRGLSEGGQMPLFRLLPKRGFSNFAFRTVYNVVNIGDLETRFSPDSHVTAESLLEVGLIRNLRHGVKVLGNGELTKKLKVEAAKFSKRAQERIEAAGGEVVVA